MTDYRSFHPYIQEAYIAVDEWLKTKLKSNGYKDRRKVKLQEKTLQSAAAQYSVLFPVHYFKVIHTLENIITPTQLLNWIEQNQHICLIDVGCGAGAATAAFLETIIRLREEEQFTHSIEVLCLGIDRNPGSLAIYNQLVTAIGNQIGSSNINLTPKIYPKGIQEVASSLISVLNQQREKWQQPCITDAIIMQSNIVSALEETFGLQQQDYDKLIELDIEPEDIINNDDKFGIEEARAYKWLLEDAAIDNLHSITIGTDEFLPSVIKMGAALDKEFSSSNHYVKPLGDGTHQVYYENPVGGYWREIKKIKKPKKPSKFHIDARTITSGKLQKDEDWNELINLNNLEKAWARARHNFLRQAIFSEVEIRVFENNLDHNLKSLQKKLRAYLEDIARTSDRISYQIPKNQLNTRSRLLSRLEEEILSTAIVQKLGREVDFLQHSYAYCLAKTENYETEYLYEPWFDAYYNKFIAKACESAQKYENGIVIEVDIKDYYKQIFQNQLISLTSQQLHTEGSRIKWLLNVLLSEKLDNHEENRGITQGGISSGFFANLYLNSIDAVFGSKHNEWNLEFHRYADDMIFVIPNPEDERSIMERLKKELEELGLCLNEDKSRRYEQLSDFWERAKKDDVLDNIWKKYNKLVRPLWIMQFEYRKLFEQHYQKESWWYFIRCYQSCLQSINIFVSKTDLSRSIYKNLFPATDYPQKKYGELNLPQFSIEEKSFSGWSQYFANQNQPWINRKKQLRLELIKLFKESYQILQESEDMLECQQAERRIRFVLNRLLTLGMEEIQESVIKIVCESPWILRYRLLFDLTESLARQGYDTQIMEILKYYEQ